MRVWALGSAGQERSTGGARGRRARPGRPRGLRAPPVAAADGKGVRSAPRARLAQRTRRQPRDMCTPRLAASRHCFQRDWYGEGLLDRRFLSRAETNPVEAAGRAGSVDRRGDFVFRSRKSRSIWGVRGPLSPSDSASLASHMQRHSPEVRESRPVDQLRDSRTKEGSTRTSLPSEAPDNQCSRKFMQSSGDSAREEEDPRRIMTALLAVLAGAAIASRRAATVATSNFSRKHQDRRTTPPHRHDSRETEL